MVRLVQEEEEEEEEGGEADFFWGWCLSFITADRCGQLMRKACGWSDWVLNKRRAFVV